METKTLPQKPKPNEPWRPASMLEAPKKPGFRRKWVRKDKLAKALMEGWVKVEGKDEIEQTLLDGSQSGSQIIKRNLVLCEMPEEMGKSRDAYFQQQTDELMPASVDKFKEAAKEGSGSPQAYGKVEINLGEGGK